MKVIFLDFDGVLNYDKYVRRCNDYGVIIDPFKMILLRQIIETTDAKIVLSTSWREHWDKAKENCDSTGVKIIEEFKKYDLVIFDKTPKLYTSREKEIKAWLKRHPTVKQFVVLDDSFLAADFLNGHFIKTSNYLDGLNETDVKKAIEILNG